MCIVALAWNLLAEQPVWLLSNRDEFYARPSLALRYWPREQLYAGRDLQSGGTWQAVNAQGRWAVLTNCRELSDVHQYSRSRGQIVLDFLHSDLAPIRYAAQLEKQQCHYAGFNLLLGDLQQAVYISNRGAAPQLLANGIYVLSNGLMHEHWYKCAHLRKRFSQEFMPLLQLSAESEQQLSAPLIDLAWDLLEDRRQLPAELLPLTGLSLDQEQQLSSVFIQSGDYGTRCSNILAIGDRGLTWLEKNQYGETAAQIQRLQLYFGNASATLLRYQHSND